MIRRDLKSNVFVWAFFFVSMERNGRIYTLCETLLCETAESAIICDQSRKVVEDVSEAQKSTVWQLLLCVYVRMYVCMYMYVC